MKKLSYLLLVTMAFFYLLYNWNPKQPKDFQAFQLAISEFCQLNAPLKELSPASLTSSIRKMQDSLAQKLRVKNSFRYVNERVVQELLSLCRKAPVKIFMRHGEQLKSPRVEKITSIGLQKIEMMREPENFRSPPTKRTLVELLGTVMVFAYIKEKLQSTVQMASSPNRRASIPAELFSESLNVQCEIQSFLRCISYPSEKKLSTKYLLRELSSDNIPWEKESVDFIIGKNAYRTITDDMKKVLEESTEDLSIFLTHTQQINAVQQISSLKIESFDHFGFIVVSEEKAISYPNGVYASSC